MRRLSLFKHLRRRSFIPALILGYVLLFQAILGPAAASAHAFAMAQQDALGLAMICVEDGTLGRKIAEKGSPEQAPPAGDCINCGIANAHVGPLAMLPPPDLVPLYLIARAEAKADALHADATLPRAALFESDLPARAPPATI